ncbi:MAG: trehalose-phosphatase [Bacteroidales bacterium]
MKKNIKLQDVETLILVLKGLQIPGSLMHEWRAHVPKVILIQDAGWQRPEHFPDPGELEDTHFILKEKGLIRLKKIFHGLPVNFDRSVLVTDQPRYMKSALSKGWALKIGLSREFRSKRPFYEAGADVVQEDPEEIVFVKGVSYQTTFVQSLPNIFSWIDKFHMPFDSEKAIYFFDYDGTLSYIVSDPSEAVIDDRMRNLVSQLSELHRVAIVSGRDMKDLRNFIRLDNLIYAGSHGFRIDGPNGLHMENKAAVELLPKLDELEQKLRNSLESGFNGVELERKHFAIAVHYRNAPYGSVKKIRNRVKELTGLTPDFKTGSGKKVIEVKPSLQWHKGKAIEWILESLGHSLEDREVVPVYVGDDLTDEDAFRTLSDDGVGILVGSHQSPSAAGYKLEDVAQVSKFIHYLVQGNEPRAIYDSE